MHMLKRTKKENESLREEYKKKTAFLLEKEKLN